MRERLWEIPPLKRVSPNLPPETVGIGQTDTRKTQSYGDGHSLCSRKAGGNLETSSVPAGAPLTRWVQTWSPRPPSITPLPPSCSLGPGSHPAWPPPPFLPIRTGCQSQTESCGTQTVWKRLLAHHPLPSHSVQILLCCGARPGNSRMVSSGPGLYPTRCQDHLQTLPDVPWGPKSSSVENPWFRSRLKSQESCRTVYTS